jgi:two-component system, OmpR family, phosphate regulon response regulator PhoB
VSAAPEQLPLVLVADDDADILALVTLRLRRDGYEVAQARNGEDALRLARDLQPDAAVLDVMMPRMTGLDVLAALRADERTSGIPVIVLTARVQQEDAARARAAGAVEYVTKPFSPHDLSARLKTFSAGEPVWPRRFSGALDRHAGRRPRRCAGGRCRSIPI